MSDAPSRGSGPVRCIRSRLLAAGQDHRLRRGRCRAGRARSRRRQVTAPSLRCGRQQLMRREVRRQVADEMLLERLALREEGVRRRPTTE